MTTDWNNALRVAKLNVPYKTYSMHKCDKKHRTVEAFLKCAMKKAKNKVGYWTNAVHSFNGSGSWAVVHTCYCRSLVTWNGNTRDMSYIQYDYEMCDTLAEAQTHWHHMNEYCNDRSRCSGSCDGKLPFIIKVEL